MRSKSQWVTRPKARLSCAFTIPMGHKTQSEVGSCIHHCSGSQDRNRGWVVHWPFRWARRPKARLACAFIISVGRKTESEAVFFANRSLLCTVIFPLTESWLIISISFHSQREEICERLFVGLVLTLEIRKTKRMLRYWYAYNLRKFIGHFVDCNVNLHPTLAFDLGYFGDLSS